MIRLLRVLATRVPGSRDSCPGLQRLVFRAPGTRVQGSLDRVLLYRDRDAYDVFQAPVTVIPRERLQFLRVLGEGAFGRVFLGTLEQIEGSALQVAVSAG